ncbi:LrgB family protein [Motilimonas pumila]|uniref:LrgB family protein n=1 Tax=Motilimonas pumila TaxID=2303987 RepID=A0A418YDF6_9GAMM|nr:LrgB family protein [Motilimonas pumila]RJG42544.1 LrgB family protein [Motilimonas pumila]
MIWLALPITILLFFAFRWVHQRLPLPIFNPVLLAIISLMALLMFSATPYQTYARGAQLLTWLLEPAVVALAIPLYQQSQQIKAQLIPLLLACCAGVLTSLIVVLLVTHLLGADISVIASLAPQAVTTPIAMNVTAGIGGIPALSAVVVILVGILGASFALPILKIFKVNQPEAQGLAMGAAAHALGTAKAIEVSRLHGAYSSVSLILCAVLTALLTPLIFSLYLLIIN